MFLLGFRRIRESSGHSNPWCEPKVECRSVCPYPLSRFRVIGSHPLRAERPVQGSARCPCLVGPKTAFDSCTPSLSGFSLGELVSLTYRCLMSRSSNWHLHVGSTAGFDSRRPRPLRTCLVFFTRPFAPRSSGLEEWKHPLDQEPSVRHRSDAPLVPTSLAVFWCARSQAPPTLDVHRTIARCARSECPLRSTLVNQSLSEELSHRTNAGDCTRCPWARVGKPTRTRNC